MRVLEHGGVVLQLAEVGDDASLGQRQFGLRAAACDALDQGAVAALKGRHRLSKLGAILESRRKGI